MRDNNDFIGELREEISNGQERRSKYVVLKLSFIIGLFGIGSLTISSVSLIPLIYLIPFVVFVFDLYILSEDFGVKRAGRFIKGSPFAPTEERRWEKAVSENRDPVTRIASVVSSLIVIMVSAVALWKSEHTTLLYCIWCILSALLTIFTGFYGISLVRRTKKLDKYLKKEGN
jgi:hypothetical protein